MTKSFASREWLPAASPRGEPVAAYYESEKILMERVDSSVRLGPPKSSLSSRLTAKPWTGRRLWLEVRIFTGGEGVSLEGCEKRRRVLTGWGYQPPLP